MKNTIVVAYSGGLDTSVMVKWLHETYDANIITYTADLGQHINYTELENKAYKTGASHVIIEDLKDQFVDDYISHAIKGNALYEGQYPLATALGRPLIAKRLVDIAHTYNANMIAHGCTGKGNDQVRLEVGIAANDPDIKILAPLRTWPFNSREKEIDYALKHQIPIQINKSSPYSIDENLWGTSIECGVIENIEMESPLDSYLITQPITETPNVPVTIQLEFENGLPIALNGVEVDLVSLIDQLNDIGGTHGIGRIDLIENRVVGIKSREIYESPAAKIILTAHQELEKLVLDKETYRFKQTIEHTFANLVYDGLWYSPLNEAIQSFLNSTQQSVNGSIKLKLFKGNVQVTSRNSPLSLYQPELATYAEDDHFNHSAAEGFIELYGLSQKVIAKTKMKGALK